MSYVINTFTTLGEVLPTDISRHCPRSWKFIRHSRLDIKRNKHRWTQRVTLILTCWCGALVAAGPEDSSMLVGRAMAVPRFVFVDVEDMLTDLARQSIHQAKHDKSYFIIIRREQQESIWHQRGINAKNYSIGKELFFSLSRSRSVYPFALRALRLAASRNIVNHPSSSVDTRRTKAGGRLILSVFLFVPISFLFVRSRPPHSD